MDLCDYKVPVFETCYSLCSVVMHAHGDPLGNKTHPCAAATSEKTSEQSHLCVEHYGGWLRIPDAASYDSSLFWSFLVGLVGQVRGEV